MHVLFFHEDSFCDRVTRRNFTIVINTVLFWHALLQPYSIFHLFIKTWLMFSSFIHHSSHHGKCCNSATHVNFCFDSRHLTVFFKQKCCHEIKNCFNQTPIFFASISPLSIYIYIYVQSDLCSNIFFTCKEHIFYL